MNSRLNSKLWRFAIALLPICLLSAQQPAPAIPNGPDPHLPSPEVMRKITEQRERMREHSIAINNLASHIQSLDDARKLVDMVADEFSDELPPKWATRSVRERIARAEFESATGALIPEQHIADVWNDFVEKIGAPQDTMLNAAEIHYARDAQYVSARLFWSQGQHQVWTIPGVFAIGKDGKVSGGARAIEAIRLLWQLGNLTDDFAAIHAQVQKGILVSDLITHPEVPPKPGMVRVSASFSAHSVSYPVHVAAFRYEQTYGPRALNHALDSMLKELFAE
jgi:hypothetical protein